MKEAANSINVGYENHIVAGRIVAIVDPKSSPIKRMIKEAGDKGLLIDATCGKPTRSAMVMDSGNIVLSAVSPGKIGARLDRTRMDKGMAGGE